VESIIWRLGIGDPTIIGWITTIGYALSAFLCARKARVLKTDILKTETLKIDTRIWSGLETLLFLLGLNKQLDFQTLLVEWGRDILIKVGR